MRYWVNYEFHCVAKQENKPEAIKKNQRYDKGFAEWKEVDEETYNKMYHIYYAEALNF